MKQELVKIGIRFNAIYLDDTQAGAPGLLRETTANLVANLARLGYVVEEALLQALNQINPKEQLAIYEAFVDVLQVKNNWAPLVKGWDLPTGEKRSDHWLTAIANLLRIDNGTRLACGHLIPDNTFPLERYNGCPFCGRPFELKQIENYGQGSKSVSLKLWGEKEMKALLTDLLLSKTALDATQADNLKKLLQVYDLPELSIAMKETQILVIDALIDNGKTDQAGSFMKTPVDIMRYLWYKKTGNLQLVEPKTIVRRTAKNSLNRIALLNQPAIAGASARMALKLKYTRPESKMVAQWLNKLPMEAAKVCELMHPKRGMWVRFIRALRLAEYAKQKGFGKLAQIIHLFYTEQYDVWAGRLSQFRLKNDAQSTFALLQERPGLFARSLFANMLWFGPDASLEAFKKVTAQLPARLLITLSSYADIYFDGERRRSVKPLGGTSKSIAANALLSLYTAEQLKEMKEKMAELCFDEMERRFGQQKTDSKTIFIDRSLYFLPLSIGDRSETLQDLPSALMGMRFPVEGDTVRLFMQWGQGLWAQHMDMDLSCRIAYANRTDICAFYSLNTTGAKHSGDIREIPNKTGTAEYINLNLDELSAAGALYVTFTCNAYSNGSITPNLVVGWMNSANPISISASSGVAYDPSCVQHQVRIGRSLTKGLVFGVLDVKAREIIWLEMPFGGQVLADLNISHVRALLDKLQAKMTVGNLLELKAKAQGLISVESAEEADEAYTRDWAMNSAAVTQLLID